MYDDFRVVLIKPEGYPHSEALREAAETVVAGLQALGREVTFAENEFAFDAVNVVFCAHLLSPFTTLAPRTILYNFEQLGAPNLGALYALGRRAQVWDYSQRNLERWSKHDVKAQLVPLGYAPEMTRIVPAREQDIDVLFYGSINPRRAALLRRLEDEGLKVSTAFGVYGAARDALIARAKVVLNIHFYDTRIFEIVRVAYLLANSKAVVSECEDDTEVELDLLPALVAVPLDRMVEEVVALLHDEQRRHDLEKKALEFFSLRIERLLLKSALERTTYATQNAASRQHASTASGSIW